MKRWPHPAAGALAALLAFAGGFLAVSKSLEHRKPVSGTRGSRAHAPAGEHTASPAATAPDRQRIASLSIPRIEYKTRPLQRWEQALLSQPAEYHTMRNELKRALRPAWIDAHGCFDETPAIGKISLQLEWYVEATETEAIAERLRFAHVRDGTPLTPDTIGCLERMLSGPFTAHAPSERRFPMFAGWEPLPLSWTLDGEFDMDAME